MANQTFKVKSGLTLTPVDPSTLTNPQVGDLICDSTDSNKIKTYNGTAFEIASAEIQTALQAHIADTTDAHAASAITNTPSGNLAATTVQGALNELQTDIDTRATSSALSSHTGASTGVHGVTGSVVGTSDTQTLSGKTFSDSVTLAEIATPSTPASGFGRIYFKADGKLYQLNDSGTETEVGAGGASGGGPGDLDVMFQQNFDDAVLGDFAQSGLTLNTSSPLHGTACAEITHSTTLTRYFQQTITVDPKFRGQPVIMTFDIQSNASAGKVTLYIEDNNAVTILDSEQVSTTAGEIVKNTISFTIPSDSTSLIYIFDCLADAAAPTTKIDDIVIKLGSTALLETSVELPNITAWQSYTPTFQGFGTPTNIEMQWRQNGENVEIRGKFTSGTPTAVEARIGLPGGLTSAGTSLIPSIQIAGHAIASGASATYFSSEILIEPSVTYLTLGQQTSATFATTKVNGTAYSASVVLTLEASVPCAGLSATTARTIPLTQSGLIQEADTYLRVTTANGYGSSGTMIRRFSSVAESRGSDVVYQDSATNGASFTIQTSGIYSITYSENSSNASTFYFGITKNAPSLSAGVTTLTDTAVLISGVGSCTGTNGLDPHSISWEGYLSAGDIIRPHTSGLATGSASPRQQFVITRQGSLKQASVITNQKATIPTSYLRMQDGNSRGSTATAVVYFQTISELSGDAFTVETDATLGTRITMKKAGRLTGVAHVYSGTSANGIYLTKNQSNLTSASPSQSEVFGRSYANVVNVGSVTGVTDVKVGDIIRITSAYAPSADYNNFYLAFQEQQVQVSVSNTLPQFSEDDLVVRAAGNAGQAITENVTNIPFITVSDSTGGAWTGSTFVVPETGIYAIEGCVFFTTVIDAVIHLYVNGVFSKRIGPRTTMNTQSFSITDSFTAGQVLSLRLNSTSGTLSNTANYHYLNITKVGRPQVTGIDVTPFVNVPQPDTQSLRGTGGSVSGSNQVTNFTLAENTGTGVLSQTASRVTALKRCTVNASWWGTSSAAGQRVDLFHYRGGTLLVQHNGSTAYTGTQVSNGAATIRLEAGDYLDFFGGNSAATISNIQYNITAEALSDTILTAPQTFSTDTAALTYASSAQYTLSTLANAPVGTYITFTYAASTNTRTQTTTRPTQTDADMNTNGILIYSRISYSTASTAAQPNVVSVQIGKGLKGVSVDAYSGATKLNPCSYDLFPIGTTGEYGAYKTYDEKSGILTIDAGYLQGSTITSKYTGLDSANNLSRSSLYFVINASTNPALTGLGLNVVAARGTNTAGTSIPNAAYATLTFDAAKTFDSHGALNASTGFFTAPETGYYNVSGAVGINGFGGNPGEAIVLEIRKNSSTIIATTELRAQAIITTVFSSSIKDVVYLAKGETVSLSVYQNSGAAANLTTAAGYNYLSISKVGV